MGARLHCQAAAVQLRAASAGRTALEVAWDDRTRQAVAVPKLVVALVGRMPRALVDKIASMQMWRNSGPATCSPHLPIISSRMTRIMLDATRSLWAIASHKPPEEAAPSPSHGAATPTVVQVAM